MRPKRRMLITPMGLAAELKVTRQAALRMLRTLREAGLGREVTGRENFRAFSVEL